MKAFAWLRMVSLWRRTKRKIRDLGIYFNDGAWINYLFAGVIFGGSLVDMLLHPERLAQADRAVWQLAAGALLLMVAGAAFLGEVVRGLDISPVILSPGDSRFILLSPLPQWVLIGERLLSLHGARALGGFLGGFVLWPFLHFVWPGLPLWDVITLGLQLALLSGIGANLGVLMALSAGAIRSVLVYIRTIGSALLLVGLVAAVLRGSDSGSAVLNGSEPLRHMVPVDGFPRLMGYVPESAWIPLLAVGLLTLVVAWAALQRAGAVRLATQSAVWLKLRSLLRAGRKAEARRLLRQTSPETSSRPWKRYVVPLYGSGIWAVVFKQLTVLVRMGPSRWLTDWGFPSVLFLTFVLFADASLLTSLGGVIGGTLLLLSVARWFRQGRLYELARLQSTMLLPIHPQQLILGQVLPPAVGLLPLTLAAAGRAWYELGGGWVPVLWVIMAAVLAAAEVSLVAFVEDWITAQSPSAQGRVPAGVILTALPLWSAVSAGPGCGMLVLLLVEGGIALGLWVWAQMEIGRAL